MGKGGGGSQPAPSSQSTTQTSVPQYAQPYVENMLGQTAALTDINQNPYQQYSGQRLSNFSPLQSQAMGNISTMQMAPQVGSATEMATAAGQGQLASAPIAYGYGTQGSQYGQQGVGLGVTGGAQYGVMGAGYGAQAAGAGQQYAQQATNPYAMQAYMNPYVQASLQPQLQLLNQQQALDAQNINAKAAGQGAFGGNRATLAQGLNAQNYDLAKQSAIAQGYDTAFKQAQQAQQFGAGLGVQGLQAGMQGAGVGLQGVGTQLAGTAQGMQGAQVGLQGVAGAQAGYSGANQAANTLNEIAKTQYAQQMGINNAQMQAGSVQQAQQQQGLDVNYQDFLKQQNYPYQQLAFQSDMLRGLPLSQASNTIYTAPPSAASQIGGLGMTGLGIYGMSGGFKGAKEGGMMQSYKEGGQVGYRVGGDISMMSDKQLMQLLSNPKLSLIERDQVEQTLALHRRMAMNPQSPKIMGGGLDTVPSGDMFEAAGGGIVAFAGTDGSLVKGKVKTTSQMQSYEDALRQQVMDDLTKKDTGVDPFAASKAREADIQSQLGNIREYSPFQALTAAGLGTMAGTSQYGLSNLGLGGLQGLKSYSQSKDDENALQKLLLTQDVEREKSKYARDTSEKASRLTALGQLDTKTLGLMNAKNTAAATASQQDYNNFLKANTIYSNAVAAEKKMLYAKDKAIFNMDPEDPSLDAQARANVAKSLSPKLIESLGLSAVTKPDAVVAPKAGAQAAPAVKGQFPVKGSITDGYRFKGGDPSKPTNWEKV